MTDVAVVAGQTMDRATEAWSPEYAAYVLEHLAPGQDWPTILVEEWLTSMMQSEELGTRPMWNSKDALYQRAGVERLLERYLGPGVTLEEVSQRIDEFQAADTDESDEDGDDGAYGFAVKLDGDAADELLCQLGDLAKRQAQTQGGALAISYALRLLADRTSASDTEQLRKLSAFAEQLCQDTASARVEVERVTRIIEANQRLQRDRQRLTAGTDV